MKMNSKNKLGQKIIIKRLVIFSMILIMVFGAFSLVWYTLIGKEYDGYAKKVGKKNKDNRSEIGYTCEENGYIYSVKKAGFLSFESGFLRVQKVDDKVIYQDLESGGLYYRDELGNRIYDETLHKIDFYYWPRVFEEDMYGIIFLGYEGFMMIRFDSSYEITNASSPEDVISLQEILTEYKSEIEEIMQKASDKWGLTYK